MLAQWLGDRTGLSVGLVHHPWCLGRETDPDYVGQLLADVELGDRLGFDICWLDEQHLRTTPDTEALQLLAIHAADRTTRIQLGLMTRPSWGTVTGSHMAQSMRSLTELSPGRILVGVGPNAKSGPDAEAGVGFATGLPDRPSRQALAAGSPGEQPAKTSVVRDRLGGRLFMVVSDVSEARMAACYGAGVLLETAQPVHLQRRMTEAYRRQGGHREVRGCRFVHVAHDGARARQSVLQSACLLFGQLSATEQYEQLVSAGAYSGRSPRNQDEMRERLGLLAGSSDEVVRQIDSYLDETGVDGIDLVFQLPALSPTEVDHSMFLFSREVLPRLGGCHIKVPSGGWRN